MKKIFKVVKKKDFVVLDKNFLLNQNLSAKAKGILAYLLSLPENWNISVRELSRHFKDGKDSIKNGLRELMKEGYVVYKKVRNKNGKFERGVYFVYEIPISKENFEDPQIEKPQTEKPSVEKPLLENPMLINKENTKYKDIVKIEDIKIVSNREISDAEKDYWKEVLKYRLMLENGKIKKNN